MFWRYTLCLKKVLTFKLSLTLSNFNWFSKFLHCWKPCEICYKTAPHLRHVATLPWDIKNSNFLQIFSRYGKMQTNSIFSHRFQFLCLRNCVCWVYLCVFIKILSSSLNATLIVDKHCSDVCCDEFPMLQTDRKSKQVKNTVNRKFYLQSVWVKLAILDT